MSLIILSHPSCAQHDMGPAHPECPERLSAINDQLIASGLDFVVPARDALPIHRDYVCLAHDPTYVDDLLARDLSQGPVWLDDDTQLMAHTRDAALHAAGAATQAVDLIMQGEATRVFCAVRPPGHHACHNKAMGFCFFNNIAIAARYAIEHYGLTRVAIVDFDVHHGNGTEDIVAGDERIQFYSSFQHPFYPFSGADATEPNLHFMPLTAGTGGKEWQTKVKQQWLPHLEQWQPELILISAGFDAHVEDDMSGIAFNEADYSWITQQLKAIADKACNGHIISLLEGGYALGALGRSVVAHLKALQ
ncbi:histone deacetylase family protein [Simiduia agarivorans]|uniref:Histone deacetylase/AcuC/AphA family protein n=1 Tax=Simiduia agarivorans (strain DSM 21679 / JCM 13881 / BCRC 17597 / SA1) TaxID=1117647 RepID=K4L2C1_SIMAS|nr:histone deacetylase family protein [Simiduia agarivorans]AFV00333.1 Histone deacetylase/AcuC/AphA family protein [Simiduia agarivorans SA1 = DSM 21679]